MLCDMIILGVLNLYIIYLIYNRPSKIVIYQQHKLLWITNLSHNNELFFYPPSLSLSKTSTMILFLFSECEDIHLRAGL